MAPLKTFLLVSSGIASALTCSNDNCEAGDQTALLQSHLTRKSELALSSTGAAFFPKLGNLNDPSTRKSALLEIQKTAVKLASMDASEATPVVIEVCTDTAQMLNETVLYAIIQEDAVDRAELASAYAQFDQHEERRLAAIAALSSAEDSLSTAEAELRDCRSLEEDRCEEVETCDVEVHPPCIACEECHNCEVTGSLCQIDREIEQRWCQESTETERMADSESGLSWRVETKNLFDRYTTAVENCHNHCDECEVVEANCTTVVTRYTTQAHDCNTEYIEWEAAKCAQHADVSGAVALYQQGYLATLTAYNDVVARVMIEEADRKVEWEVLTRVICLLLTLTNTEDGDAASADNQALIQRCWDEPVDTTHLDIDYLDPPAMGPIPVNPLPCAGPFIDPIYGIDIVDVIGLKPSPACYAAIIEHGTLYAREGCACPDLVELSIPEFQLGHFLLIDPSIADFGTQADYSQWTAQIFGVDADSATQMVGSMSAPHAGALPDITADFFSEEEVAVGGSAEGGIAFVSWAYGSSQAFPASALTLEERFAQNGGLLYMDAQRRVIAARLFASSSTDLNQPATAFMSFEQSKAITPAQFTDTCGAGQDVTNTQHSALGAQKYCWTQGTLSGDGWSCATGCFVYKTSTGDVAFPHSATTSASLPA